jgi:hypothetical protein
MTTYFVATMSRYVEELERLRLRWRRYDWPASTPRIASGCDLGSISAIHEP